MKRKERDEEKVHKCFGCGEVLSVVEQGIGLCSACSERSITEGFELFELEERDKRWADEMMYL